MDNALATVPVDDVVAILNMEMGAHAVIVRMRNPDGTPSMPNPPEISVHAVAGQDVNVIVELNNMTFNLPGEHRFDLEVDGELVGSVPVAIVR